MAVVVAIDAGTTGVRTAAVDEDGAIVDLAYRELAASFPRPGWVEQDPDQIWAAVLATLREVAGRLGAAGVAVAGLGLTNQRETVVPFDRRTGRPLHRAIVWQDRRTAAACEQLEAAGHLPTVRGRTGLVLDPYFSATKMSWLLREGAVAAGRRPDLALGTVDTWLLWNLTGGAATNRDGGRGPATDGAVFATDVTNASRTSLLDIGTRRWSGELCELFGVPPDALAEVRPSAGSFGVVHPSLDLPSNLAGLSIAGVAGDQHAALFGQACFDAGSAKATYGTGTFVLVNAGPAPPAAADGLLTTIAWDLGAHGDRRGPVAYALEGAAFSSGAAIQWLRDGLGIVEDAAAVGPLAASVPGSEGVAFVPAFTGLGSPVWDPRARGTVTGITRGSGRAHLARAVVEAIACEVRAMADAMRAAGRPISTLRVDGGAAAMSLLLELQAEQLGVAVARPRHTESTVLGAATLAGLALGVWGSLDDVAALWSADAEYGTPGMPGPVDDPRPSAQADAVFAGWLRARDRSLVWARD